MRDRVINRDRVPPGPEEQYGTAQDLLKWIGDQFQLYGNIFQASIYGRRVYVTRDTRHAQHVLRERWQNYGKGLLFKRVGMLLGNGLVVSEGQLWRTQRRMIQPAFHRETIAGLVDMIRRVNLTLLKEWEEAARQNQSVNVTHDISAMVLETTLRLLFSIDYERVEADFRVLSQISTRDLQFMQKFRSLERLIIQIVTRRRETNSDLHDLVGALMRARDSVTGHAMTDNQLVSEIKTLIVAGHETTASTLNWIWYLLGQNPEAEQKLLKEVARAPLTATSILDHSDRFSFVRCVINEALRMYPAVWLITRKALYDDQLGEYWVPSGTEIYLPVFHIQRHSELWENPDDFDPDRFAGDNEKDRHPLSMLPFSAGPRNCIGEYLARIEMEVHLVTIARRLRLRPVGAQSPEFEAAVNLRSKQDFIMNPELRSLSDC